MKKILIIGCVLMGTFLSAMNLPDHIKVVDHEKIAFNAPKSIFVDQVLLVNDSVVSEFVLEQKNQLQPQVFAYVLDIDVMDSKGFYKPVVYESFTKRNPLSNYDIYKTKDKFRKVLFANSRHLN